MVRILLRQLGGLLSLLVVCGLAIAEPPTTAWTEQWIESKNFVAPDAKQAAAADETQAFVVSNTNIAIHQRATGALLSVTKCPDATHLNSAFVHERKVYCAHSNYPATPEVSEICAFDPDKRSWDIFHRFDSNDGSLTWAVFKDSAWWCFFAYYDADNIRSYLAKFDVSNPESWKETQRWTLPESLVRQLGQYSLSGGIWAGDELLVTGHSGTQLFRLRTPAEGEVLDWVGTDETPFDGQGIAIDPATGGLVGIRRSDTQVVFADPPSSRALRLRILSYNIHHCAGVDGKLDVARIAGVIQSVNPDIVAIQEIDQGADRTGAVDQPKELAELTQMHVEFGNNISIPGGLYGNAILSRFPIAGCFNHPLPNSEGGEQRGLLDAKIQLPNGRKPLRFMATHLDHRSNDQDRWQAASLIQNLTNAQPDDWTILAGDLNDRLGSRTLDGLLEVFSLPHDGELPTVPVGKPRRQIDFILIRPADRLRAIETRVLDEPIASDHRPILTVVETMQVPLAKQGPT